VVVETSLDDALLFARARRGDREAFALFVERNQDSLVSFATHLTGSREGAEDVAQETFLRMLERTHDYREQGKVNAYLFRIAANLVRSQERKRRRRQLISSIFLERERPAFDPAQQKRLLGREAGEQIGRALARVPHPYRAALVLSYVEGLPLKEIADILGCRDGTVKSRIHRGLNHLRAELRDYWEGAGE
jgi:RNA polymerase sigma-70 factor (ECF subfamily)